jgi:hypothetical protein
LFLYGAKSLKITEWCVSMNTANKAIKNRSGQKMASTGRANARLL